MGFCRISTSPSFIPPPSPERRISSIVRRNRSNVSTPRVIVTPGNSRRTSVSLLPAGCASCHHRISRCAPNTCPYTSNEYCSPVSPVFVFYKLTPRAWKEFVSKRWRRTDGRFEGQGGNGVERNLFHYDTSYISSRCIVNVHVNNVSFRDYSRRYISW